MQTWLLKMAAEFSHRKDQLVFLINNYDMIISVVAVSTFILEISFVGFPRGTIFIL